MLSILEIVLPVFLVLGSGYAAIKTGLLTEVHADGLMKYAQSIAIPCLLFSGVSQLDLGTVFHPALLASYYTGSFTVFVLGILGARMIFKRRPGEAVAVGFCAMFSNTVLIGLPIMERAYGTTEFNFAIISVHATFCYFLGFLTMEFSRAGGRGLYQTLGVVFKAMFSNPLMIGIGLGLAVNLLSIPLPSPLVQSIDMVVKSALPAALFALGGILVRYSLTDRLSEIAMVLVLRLIVHPLIALTMTTVVFDLPPILVQTAVISAAMAPGVNVFVFASIYDRAKGTAASSVLLGTVASIFSVTIWLLILGT
jgi:malonate transporter